MRVLVVAPTFNEVENIDAFLRLVRQNAPLVDIVIVDDNSPDGTGNMAESLGSELGQIKVLRRAAKSGLGNAYRSGFQLALDESYDVIVSMDVDLSHDPAAITDLIDLIDKGADVAIGSRYVPGGETINWPSHRRLLSRWGNRYARWVLAAGVNDCTSGFRAYRASVLATIDPSSTTADGYAFLTELIRRLVGVGAEIAELPITFRDRERGVSKMSSRIIIESMLLVSWWGLTDRMSGRTRRHDKANL